METITTSSFFCGMATAYFAINAYYLIKHAPKTRFNRVLGGIFVWWALANAKDIVLSIPQLYVESTLNIIAIIDGWSSITYACLMFELSMPGWTTWRNVGLLSIPLALSTLLFIAMPSNLVADIYMCFLIIFGLAIFFVGYHKAKIYIRYVHENYSNIDNIDISWIRTVCLMAFPIQLLWVLATLVGQQTVDSIYYVMSMVMWQMVVHYCRNLEQVELPAEAGEETNANAQRSYPFADELERMVEEEKLFLNPTLSLADLTSRIGTNRTYLSDYFCNVKGVTFYDYINSLRINKMSVPLMAEHPEYTIEYIATQSGFNSLSTFRRAFKKFTGHSPRDYRNKDGQ